MIFSKWVRGFSIYTIHIFTCSDISHTHIHSHTRARIIPHAGRNKISPRSVKDGQANGKRTEQKTAPERQSGENGKIGSCICDKSYIERERESSIRHTANSIYILTLWPPQNAHWMNRVLRWDKKTEQTFSPLAHLLGHHTFPSSTSHTLLPTPSPPPFTILENLFICTCQIQFGIGYFWFLVFHLHWCTCVCEYIGLI